MGKTYRRFSNEERPIKNKTKKQPRNPDRSAVNNRFRGHTFDDETLNDELNTLRDDLDYEYNKSN